MLFINPVYPVLAYAMVVAHRASSLDRLFAYNLLNWKMVLFNLIFRRAVHHIIPVYKVKINSVGVAVGGVGAE